VDLAAVGQQIVSAIVAARPEIEGSDRPITVFTSPCVMIFLPNRITYGNTMGTGFADPSGARVSLLARLYIEHETDGSDYQALRAYLSTDGAESLSEIINMAGDLGGSCDFAQMIEARNIGNWAIGRKNYLGADLIIQVDG
jgi:hypothetical protein